MFNLHIFFFKFFKSPVCCFQGEMNMWIPRLNFPAGGAEGSPAKASTLPAMTGEKSESKKRGFFTLGGKKK